MDVVMTQFHIYLYVYLNMHIYIPWHRYIIYLYTRTFHHVWHHTTQTILPAYFVWWFYLMFYHILLSLLVYKNRLYFFLNSWLMVYYKCILIHFFKVWSENLNWHNIFRGQSDSINQNFVGHFFLFHFPLTNNISITIFCRLWVYQKAKFLKWNFWVEGFVPLKFWLMLPNCFPQILYHQ